MRTKEELNRIINESRLQYDNLRKEYDENIAPIVEVYEIRMKNYYRTLKNAEYDLKMLEKFLDSGWPEDEVSKIVEVHPY